ncbi:hypothetical protein [Isoptericola croceus]|uniref:hypothetical protein n=1 Tax=Isoptericola croceus TaxID=3031406 RepID=UPI0023F7CF6D|nr:hypothetical protein [Isoptericola croceus]
MSATRKRTGVWQAALVGLLLTVAAVLGLAQSAAASTSVQPTASHAVAGHPATAVTASVPMRPYDGSSGFTSEPTCGVGASRFQIAYLPVNRWSDATTGFHNRLGAKAIDDPDNKVQRFAQSGTVTVGTFFWTTSTDLANSASRFCILDSAGAQVDEAFASIGKAVLGIGKGNSGGTLAAIIITLSFIMLFVRAARSGKRPWKKVLTVLIIAGVLVTMVAGSMASTGGDGDPYRPGMFSPGWFVSKANSVVSKVLSGPAAALAIPSVDDSTSGRTVNCETYESVLSARSANPQNDRLAAASAVPRIMSQMWVDSGKAAWAQSQYGIASDAGTKFVSCHQLDMRAGVSPSDRAKIWNEAVEAAGITHSDVKAPADGDSVAFNPRGTIPTDNSLIGWAACRATENGWKVADEFKNVGGGSDAGSKGGKITEQVCKDWFGVGDKDASWSANKSALEFENSEQIREATEGEDNDEARSFLMNLQGHETTAGQLASLAYVFSGLAILGSFALLAVAIIIGKVVQIVMMLLLIFALVASLWAGKADDMIVAKYARNFLGVTVFVAVGALLFAVLAVLTRVIVGAGTSIFGGGTLMGVLWTGAGPLIALLVINMVIKAAGGPSPFKLNSALAFGAAAGAVGGVAASKVDAWGQRGKQAAGNAARGATQRVRGGGQGAGAGRGGQTARAAGAGRSSLVDSQAGATARGGAAGAAAGGLAAAAGRRGSHAARLQAHGAMSREETRRASEIAATRTPTQRVADRAEAAQEMKAARADAKVARRAERDQLAQSGGWSGARTEGGRVRLRDQAARTAGLARGKAGQVWSNTRASIAEDPKAAAIAGLRRTAKVGAAGAALVAAPVVAAPILGGMAAAKASRSARQIPTARREKRQYTADQALAKRVRARQERITSDPAHAQAARERIAQADREHIENPAQRLARTRGMPIDKARETVIKERDDATEKSAEVTKDANRRAAEAADADRARFI